MDEIPMDPENEDPTDGQLRLPSGEVEASEGPAPENPQSRWKKRALWAAGIAAAAGAAVLVYLKATADRDDLVHSDDLDDDLWAEDGLDDEEADDGDDEDGEDEDWIVDDDLRDYLDEQQAIVDRLIVEVETLDEDERQSLYDQLDVDHQIQASDDLADWADDAVGHPSWRSDD